MALPTGPNNRHRFQAIQTEYDGYKFRSRLEARWAVFFNELGAPYEYEPEGYVLLDGSYYLPDFRVTSPQGQITWYEVKAPNDASASKMQQLEEAMGRNPELEAARDRDEKRWELYHKGELLTPEQQSQERLDQMTIKAWQTTCFVTLPGDPYRLLVKENEEWCTCPRCGLVNRPDAGYYPPDQYGNELGVGCGPCDYDTPSGGGNPEEPGIFVPIRPHKGTIIVDAVDAAKYIKHIEHAATRARRARFEHGERP